MTVTDVEIFDKVRTRYLVIAWLLIPFFLPVAGFLFEFFELSLNWYSWQLAYIYYGHVFMAAAILLTALFPVRLPLRRIIGATPSRNQFVSGFALSAYLYILAWPAAYVLWLPFSYWAPTLVDYWFIDTGEIVYFDYETYPVLANLLQLVSLCVLAPIIEEIAFRGIILHRWARKYGVTTAVLTSSLLFGAVHPDPLGAFFFGIGMCILYLRTQSLVLPIVCHGVYNLVVWLVELGYKLRYGPESHYSLEQFQDEWPFAVVALILVIAWTAVYVRRPRKDVAWRLPIS